MENCKGCGQCCYEFYLKDKWFDVELHDKDRLMVPLECQEFRNGGDENQPYPYMWMKRKANGACICFDEGKRTCKIYNIRPSICESFGPDHEKCKKYLRKNSI